MVNPILLFAAALAGAFLLPLIRRIGSLAVEIAAFAILLFAVFVPVSFVPSLLAGGQALEVMTGGGEPPLSINLRLGLVEALVASLVNLVAVGSLLRLSGAFRGRLAAGEVGGYALFVLMVMGANGIIMTRDLFNVFVFLEIMSIATYGLLVVGKRGASLQAAFKYIIAGGLASALFLIGVILLYRETGTLNIDGMIAARASQAGVLGNGLGGLGKGAPASLSFFAGAFLLLASVLIELKPFPANGWALDVYEAAHPGVAASISAATASAVIVVLYKVLPILDVTLVSAVSWIGIGTFFAANLMGLSQTDERRMLGYSSVAQIGLVAFAVAQGTRSGWMEETIFLVAGGLLVNHLLAKAGLFWTTGAGGSRGRARLVVIAALVFALVGLPPFPGFWAKWELVHQLAGSGAVQMVLILTGTLFEALYLLRWLGRQAPAASSAASAGSGARDSVLAAVAASFLLALGTGFGVRFGLDDVLLWLPAAAVIGFLVLDVLPVRMSAVLGVAALGWLGWTVYGAVEGLRLVFAALFTAGGVLILIGVMYCRERMRGFVPMVVAATGALVGLTLATTTLEFFFSWEILTIATYLLVLRGKRSAGAALRFAGFSLGGALAILAGFTFLSPESLLVSGTPVGIGWALLALGFLAKAGAVGLHVWLPETYGAVDDEGAAFLSGLVSKAAVFGLVILAAGTAIAGGASSGPATAALGWIGVATALIGALLAVFQEDAKQLLAYSSMSQVGYMVLGIALMSHLGWVSSVYLTVLHAVFKVMLFLAIAGVIRRAGTSEMYRLGGLIKRMPLTFVSVLMAIIAVSGVPPLAGFGGKWLLYTALVEKGWYLQAGFAFFASAVAFLYLFRLIHTIFLGQLKDEHRGMREAPLSLLLPQVILIVVLMVVSMFPNLLVDPIIAAVEPYFAATVSWDGYTVISSLGYWNGNLVMYVTMAVFALPLIWLVVVMRRPQHVEQFNIVYAAERPERPETTHFAHNFFAPYRRALGFAVTPLIRSFWAGLTSGIEAVGAAVRRIYTGNGQTYALHIVLFVVILFLAVGGYR